MPASPSTRPSASSAPNEGSGPRGFRFRPRYAFFAYGMLAIGAAFAASPWLYGIAGDARPVALVIGCGSIAMAVLYLLSPAWRISVVVDDAGLEVLASGKRRFRLEWTEIVKVVASPSTKTCFVDGGEPMRSLKLPGKGAPAAYAIEGREALYDLIVSRTPPERIEEVVFLEAQAIETSADERLDAADDRDSRYNEDVESNEINDDNDKHPPAGD